jgi:hypothetical protein
MDSVMLTKSHLVAPLGEVLQVRAVSAGAVEVARPSAAL